MRKFFISTIFCWVFFSAYSQYAPNESDMYCGTVMSEEREEKARSIESSKTNIDARIKQVLGAVYVEVGHIPEPQWFEMEPIAEIYIQAMFKARAMDDRKMAALLVAEARVAFETAIDAKLTDAQKNTRVQKRKEADAWSRQKLEYATSPKVMETARSQMKANGGVATITQK